MSTNTSIELIENNYKELCVAYFDSIGEHDACMYMSSFTINDSQKRKALALLEKGESPSDIAYHLFKENFI